jgi:HK97 family phage major capsid protein
MPTTQDLREQRANRWEQMKALIAKDERSAEENETYDRLEAEVDKLAQDIERQERHAAREKAETEATKVDRSGVVPRQGGAPDAEKTDEEKYADAFRSFVRHGSSDMDPADRQILARNFVAGQELRALGVATGAAGGYTVPPGFRNRMVETMKTFGGMLDAAEVITTDTGANLQWPTNDDTANVGAILAENTQVTEQDVTIGTNSLDAYMYTSKLVRASLQLLQDSAFDADSWLARKLGERIGRILNQHFTTGTGTAQPDGLVTGATVGKQGTTGQTTTVIYDDLIDLIDSIDPAYQGSAGFMLSQGARKVVRKLKDSQNRPLWEPSIQSGVPDSLLGYGLRINQDMPAPAASAKSILFGDFREAYVIRLVTSVQMLRLAERYADFLQVGFLAFQRADGTMQNSAAVRAYQHSAT